MCNVAVWAETISAKLQRWKFNANGDVFYISGSLRSTKTTGKGLQRVTSRVRYVTDPDKPRPQEHVTKGARPCWAALEKRKRKLGVHEKIYSYINRLCLLTILVNSQVSKSYVLKQRFLILLLASPCSVHALHHSLSHSDRQISSNKLFRYTSHSNEKRYTWTRVRLLCCIKALIRIKPFIKW